MCFHVLGGPHGRVRGRQPSACFGDPGSETFQRDCTQPGGSGSFPCTCRTSQVPPSRVRHLFNAPVSLIFNIYRCLDICIEHLRVFTCTMCKSRSKRSMEPQNDPQDRNYYYNSHFTETETEVRRGEVTELVRGKAGSKPGQSGSRALCPGRWCQAFRHGRPSPSCLSIGSTHLYTRSHRHRTRSSVKTGA